MRPNFFLIFRRACWRDLPGDLYDEFLPGAGDKPFLNRFIRTFPTVTVIEMDVVVEQIRSIVQQVSAAIELVLAVILAAGSLVLVAGVRPASMPACTSAILRALGARRGLVLGGLFIEFATWACSPACWPPWRRSCRCICCREWVMDMRYTPSPWMWPLGIGAGMVLIGGLGVFSCRKGGIQPAGGAVAEL